MMVWGYKDFINIRLLIHKYVKIRVDKWILETTRPHKHVTVFGICTIYFVSRMKNWKQNFSVDEWISEVTRPLDEWLKFLNKTPGVTTNDLGGGLNPQYVKQLRIQKFQSTTQVLSSVHRTAGPINILVFL